MTQKMFARNLDVITDKRHITWGLVGLLALCFVAASIGGLATAHSIPNWYVTLNKPSWNPPNWLFGPVWTVLYAMMAVAAWMVWRRAGTQGGSTALIMFVVQLMLNVLWSVFFFGLRNPALALAEIVLLWFAIAATTYMFWKIRPLAGQLFVPYLLWVSFAAFLNFTLWRLNP